MWNQRFHFNFLASALTLSCALPPINAYDSYTSALQTIALFGLKLNRFPAMIGASIFFILYVWSPLVRPTTEGSVNPGRALSYYPFGFRGPEVRRLIFSLFRFGRLT